MVASTSSKPRNIEDVFQKTILEYESQRELQALVLNRRLLREEMARPKTGSSPLLVSTKLAVMEVYLHYAIYHLALQDKGPLQAQMLEFHTAKISQILKTNFPDVVTAQRANLLILDPLNYPKEDHMTTVAIFAWMKAKQRFVTKDNCVELESDLPKIAFNVSLSLAFTLETHKV
jgi:hypothetical protein